VSGLEERLAGSRGVVALDRVSRAFGAIVAVNDVSLAIEPGEFLTLLGPSGCGKTTLLNLIAGFLEPSAGTIRIGGRDVGHLPPHLRGTGMVFQNYALFPHMNVFDNVAFGLRMRRRRRAEVARLVGHALAMVALDGFESRRVRQLSGGQQQRVALARAIVIEPEVLLLDEPLSALDKNLRGQMQVELKALQRALGITTVFVTHDQSEALSMSDRIVVLDRGRIQQIATPVALYNRPANGFVASFIGEINHLRGALRRTAEGTFFEPGEGQRLVLPGSLLERCEGRDEAHLFVRPEHLAVVDESDAANVLSGTVETHVYQGTHTQLHAAVPGCGSIQVRVSGGDVITRYPAGAPVRIRFDLGEALLLPEEGAG